MKLPQFCLRGIKNAFNIFNLLIVVVFFMLFFIFQIKKKIPNSTMFIMRKKEMLLTGIHLNFKISTMI